ncbi:MAG TPA: hypothetical protein IAB62_07870 [Candidatus Coprocola pullicola]|nr:hypothetical protein [Candidatus Coprocola pullicola]
MRKKQKVIDREKLVDIRDVVIDRNLPKEERIKEYVRQIKNPYCFKCGKYVVISKFSENGLSLENCLKGILL